MIPRFKILLTWFALLGLPGMEDCAKMDDLEKECQVLDKEMDELMELVSKDSKNLESCDQLYKRGYKTDGIHDITRENEPPFKVYCQFNYENSGNNWMVIQRRTTGLLTFYRTISEYKHGFGDKNSEFWIGLDFLHSITYGAEQLLRVEMEDFAGKKAFAEYRIFKVGDEKSHYELQIGEFNGTADDSMGDLNGAKFSTHDSDHDEWVYNCAEQRHGAWWYKSCTFANLNGKYMGVGESDFRGVYWFYWKHSVAALKQVEMKIRPLH